MSHDEESDFPPKPELLEIRWVCGVCLRVIHESLAVSWVWKWDHTVTRSKTLDNPGKNYWEPVAVEGPRCHGRDMLILGEPKIDIHGLRGYGLVIDPLEDMRCPRIMAA